MTNSARRRMRRKLLAARFAGKSARAAGQPITANPYGVADLGRAIAWTQGYQYELSSHPLTR